MIKIFKFFSKSCGPCKVMSNHLKKVTDVPVIDVDIMEDENDLIVQKYNVRAVPTIAVIDEDRVIKEFKGVVPEDDFLKEINSIIEDYKPNN